MRLRFVLALCGVVFGSLCVPARAANEPLAMFRGSLSHAGVYAGRGSYAYGGVQWRFRARGAIHGSPTVAGGVVYVGSSDGSLYALDAASGAVRWSRALGGPVASAPAIAGGTVYVQTLSGRAIALRATNGATVWERRWSRTAPLAWGHESGDLYASSPAVVRGMVLFGGADGALHALDAATGRDRWQVATGGRVRSSPAVDGDRVFVGSFDGDVYAADVRTGRTLWRFESAGHALASRDFGYDRRSIQSSPAVARGVVCIGSRDGHLYGLDARTGRELWRLHDTVWWINASPAMEGGRAYATSSDGRYIEAVEAATGKPVWTLQTDANFFASASIAGETLFAADFGGHVRAVDKNTGRELWRFQAEGSRMVSTPAIAGDRLYVGTDDGSVFALNLVHGAALRRAVFWDAAYAQSSLTGSHEAIKTYLAARQYEVLDADALRTFLAARIEDRAPSVVVFAMDDLPDALRDGPSGRGIFRRYLDAGGKVIWSGVPPLLVQRDRTTGAVDIKAMDRGRPRALLDVGFERSNFDPLSERVTPSGRRWNLEGWWNGTWSADAATVSEVLARDEDGGAGMYVKSYGGPPGTGFVGMRVPEGGPPSTAYLGTLQIAAEYFPR